MKNPFSLILLLFIFPSLLFSQSSASVEDLEKMRQLKDFINKEESHYKIRETKRKNLLEDLDSLNAKQNTVRKGISEIQENHQEMSMALKNLSLEYQKQRRIESLERKRLTLLLKVLYRVHRDGVIRYLTGGGRLSELSGRLRVLYRAIRSHSQLVNRLLAQSESLSESEKQLSQTTQNIQTLLTELSSQEEILREILLKKGKLLAEVKKKQNSYLVALGEYKKISKKLSRMFKDFEAERKPETDKVESNSLKNLIAPIQFGTVVKKFGKSVHKKFGTVTYFKGIEIAAKHQEPVQAVLSGRIEFEGWIKGMGNVIIIHHGQGLYSLSAHLFKANKVRGEQVSQGDVIGLVGDTGGSEEPSLYFELRKKEEAIDPLLFLPKDAFSAIS